MNRCESQSSVAPEIRKPIHMSTPVTAATVQVSGGVVKEVTCGGAQRSDVDGSKEVGAWPLMGDAVARRWSGLGVK